MNCRELYEVLRKEDKNKRIKYSTFKKSSRLSELINCSTYADIVMSHRDHQMITDLPFGMSIKVENLLNKLINKGGSIKLYKANGILSSKLTGYVSLEKEIILY